MVTLPRVVSPDSIDAHRRRIDVQLPLTELTPGAYLLNLMAGDDDAVKRTVGFVVR